MVNKKAICYALLLGLICVSEVRAGKMGKNTYVRKEKSSTPTDTKSNSSGTEDVSQRTLLDTAGIESFAADLGVPPTFTGQGSYGVAHEAPSQVVLTSNPVEAHLEHIQPGDGDTVTTSTNAKEAVNTEPQSPVQAEVDREGVVPASGHDQANGSVVNDNQHESFMAPQESCQSTSSIEPAFFTDPASALQSKPIDQTVVPEAETQVRQDEEVAALVGEDDEEDGAPSDDKEETLPEHSSMSAPEGYLDPLSDSAPTEPVSPGSEADPETPVFGAAKREDGISNPFAREAGTSANDAEYSEQAGQASRPFDLFGFLPQGSAHQPISSPLTLVRQSSGLHPFFGYTTDDYGRLRRSASDPGIYGRTEGDSSEVPVFTGPLDITTKDGKALDLFTARPWTLDRRDPSSGADRRGPSSGAFSSRYLINTSIPSSQPQKLRSDSCYIFPPNMTQDEIAKLSDEEIQAKYPKLEFWLWDSGVLRCQILYDNRWWFWTGDEVNESNYEEILHRISEEFKTLYFPSVTEKKPLLAIMDRDSTVERKIPPSNSNAEVVVPAKTSFPTLLGSKNPSAVTNLSENKSDKQSGKGGKRDDQKPNGIKTDWEGAFSFADVGQDNQENIVPENARKNKLSGEEQQLPNQTPRNA